MRSQVTRFRWSRVAVRSIVGVAAHERYGLQGTHRTDRGKANGKLLLHGRGLLLRPPREHQAWAHNHRVEPLEDEGIDSLGAGVRPPFIQPIPEQRGWADSGPLGIENGAHRLGSSSRRKASRTRPGEVPSMHPVPGTSLP